MAVEEKIPRSVPKRKIDCIVKPDSNHSHTAIVRVGGVGQDDVRFNITREECATHLQRGEFSYVVVFENVEVIVEPYEIDGKKYIRTRRHSGR
jgi:Protein of unknown function (DUF3892)